MEGRKTQFVVIKQKFGVILHELNVSAGDKIIRVVTQKHVCTKCLIGK